MSIELITVEITGDAETAAELQRINSDLSGERLEDLWRSAVEVVSEVVRERVPRDLGYLAGSIEEEIIYVDEDIAGTIYSDRFYAPFQERGTDPYFPNVDALEDWAERRGLSVYVVCRAIASRGLEPRRYMTGPLEEKADEVFELIGGGVGQVIEGGY